MNGGGVRQVMRGTRIVRHLTSRARPQASSSLTSIPNGLLRNRVDSNALLNQSWIRCYNRRVPFVPPTINELPIPSGSWEKNYKLQNEKYNKHLIMGVSFLLFTLFVTSQIVEFNFFPPPLPLDADDDMCRPVEQPKKCS